MVIAVKFVAGDGKLKKKKEYPIGLSYSKIYWLV